MPDGFAIPLDPHVPPVQHGRHRVPIEAREENEGLKEVSAQDIITPQVEPTS